MKKIIIDNKFFIFTSIVLLITSFLEGHDMNLYYFLAFCTIMSIFIDKLGPILKFISITKLISILDDSNLKLKISEKKFKDFFMNSNVPMCIFDHHNLKFLDVNPNFASLMEYSTEEIVGKDIKEFILPEDYSGSVYAVKLKLDEYVNRYVSKTGKILIFKWTGTKPDENGVSSVVATFLGYEL